MDNRFTNMFERPYRDPSQMSHDEILAELSNWRNIWTWIEASTQYWLTRIGEDIRVIKRDYKAVDGTLGKLHFELKGIEVETVERIYNYHRGEATYESKTVSMPISAIFSYEFIASKEVRQETYDGKEPQEPGVDLETRPLEQSFS